MIHIEPDEGEEDWPEYIFETCPVCGAKAPLEECRSTWERPLISGCHEERAFNAAVFHVEMEAWMETLPDADD